MELRRVSALRTQGVLLWSQEVSTVTFTPCLIATPRCLALCPWQGPVGSRAARTIALDAGMQAVGTEAVGSLSPGSLVCAGAAECKWVTVVGPSGPGPILRTQGTLSSVTELPSADSAPDMPTSCATLTFLMPAGRHFLEAARSALLHGGRRGGQGAWLSRWGSCAEPTCQGQET